MAVVRKIRQVCGKLFRWYYKDMERGLFIKFWGPEVLFFGGDELR